MQLATPRSDEVHVWLAQLDLERSPAAIELSSQERERAEGFLRQEDAGRWVSSRLALRLVLSGYLGEPGAEVEIVSGENGKPRLAGGELEFNLSHSGGLALIAVARNRAVGVDVEEIVAARDLLALAHRALDEAEVTKVRDSSPAARAAVFYDAWDRHEARLKGLGAGLTGAAPPGPVAVASVDAAPGYAAAVAVAGDEIGRLRCRPLPPG